jgi:signal transduction histidine kinase/DNA-binding response OmpR family regulator
MRNSDENNTNCPTLRSQSQGGPSDVGRARILPKILVIDDDPFQVQLLVTILKLENYEIIGYNDNLKALEDAARIMPDLILLDLIMPHLDGFEICRRLKADEQTRNIPVIFVTARKDQATESEGFKLGAVDYVTKPFNPVVIKARIRTHLELKRHRDSLELLVQERTAERDKSQQQFQDLVEKSLVGVAIVQDDRVAYQNPELTRTIPAFADKIENRDFGFVHAEHLPQLKSAYEGILSGRTSNVESDIRILSEGRESRNQEYRWFNCRASTFTYQGKEAILINLVDITHTKELEKLLLNRNKMASLGRIASGMAHEIRNPLTGITSYLYTLEQLCESQTLLPKDIDLMKEIVSQLKLASHKVDAVIKRVLDFSKPTAPQMVLIDINRCLENVIGLTAVTMRKAGIQVSTSLEKNLPKCYGDVVLIEQVFLNLIQNAARALKGVAGNKSIAIGSCALENQICIAVSDSGHGVPEELKEKIFDPFFTTNPDGSGIGLSIAQRIVTDHNGTLSVQPGELGGALFTVTLPIEKRKIPR